jgi:CDP-paratose 2-epimerase
MDVVLITGSSGLVGSEAACAFAEQGLRVIGIDNDMRRHFFGEGATTLPTKRRLLRQLGSAYEHHDLDVRDDSGLKELFVRHGKSIGLVIHAAAQPSHDWAASNPVTDFEVNAVGTLNLLEQTRQHCPEAVFIFVSTNKVYGDASNQLPFIEQESRWELEPDHDYYQGIREDFAIDQSLHSLFGVSKTAADLMVQEYGRYFDMKTVCFRGGCLTGPNHSGAELHGFLAYLMKCAATGRPYTVYGYKAKQVRDNLHSADLIQAFKEVFQAPVQGEVYNLGGGRENNCSMLEAIELCQEIASRELTWDYSDQNRRGDHIWWVSDNGKFKTHFPAWRQSYSLVETLQDIYESNLERWERNSDA